MTDKERIKQEIERRYNCEKCCPLDREANVAAAVLQELLLFIDSLPEEPASEDLEEFAIDTWNNYIGLDLMHVDEAVAFANKIAEWQKQKDQETIELAEDHAMLAGMMKEREEMMKDAVNAIFIQDYAYKTPILYGNLKDKMNIVSGQTIKLCQIKEKQQ